ncbi:MAG: thioredoxin family protein [Gemmatimonadota bacterium]|jgi:hypothetical protein
MDAARYEAAPTFSEYLETVEKNRELWHGVYERVRLPEDLVALARGCEGTWRLLALTADWCGDAVNTLPVMARFAEAVEWDLRVLDRDENPDVMDAHLTDGHSRSIPVVIVYDEDFGEVGWWGPRPAALQKWVLREGRALTKEERYKKLRWWYARDRGRTAVAELMDMFCERLAGQHAG